MTSPLRRLMLAVDRKAGAWYSELHPAWVEAATAKLGPFAASWCSMMPAKRQAALLAHTYDLVWPGLDQFRQPAHRIALLDRGTLLKVLAACSLDGRRDSVRKSVGRVVRELLIEGIGESAYKRVLNSPSRSLQAAAPLGAVDVSPERLAIDGFHALCAQGVLQHPSLVAMVQLSLAPGVSTHPGTVFVQAQSGDRVIDQIQDYFPELAWLFGSDMDLALSA